jgi:hypothetical protein
MLPQRRIIRNQSLGAILLALPAIWLFILASQARCDPSGCGRIGLLFMPAALLAIGAVVLYLTSLIEALSWCIRMKTWRWLFAILPFGPVGIFLFGVAGPKDGMPELDDWFDPTTLHKRRQTGD